MHLRIVAHSALIALRQCKRLALVSLLNLKLMTEVAGIALESHCSICLDVLETVQSVRLVKLLSLKVMKILATTAFENRYSIFVNSLENV